jgi:carbamoyl-phosphate synthase large subunit
LADLGFNLYTTQGTHDFLARAGIQTQIVRKHSQGRGSAGEPTAVDLITEGTVSLVINTPLGRGTRQDGWMIRTAAIARSVPCITTIAGFKAAVAGIRELQGKPFGILSVQEWLAINE